jgi:Flp pilus assembly protein TadG
MLALYLRLQSFLGERSGSVAVVIALMATVLFVTVGVGVDMARAYRAQHALQVDVDQAAIAAAAVAYSEADGGPANVDEMNAKANEYFAANNRLKTELASVGPVSFVFDEETNTVKVAVDAKVPTTLMRLAGIPEVKIKVSSEAKRPEPPPLEVALVLDRTWSMSVKLDGKEKYKTLQEAATSLVEDVMVGENAAVGVVPFATWLKVDNSYWGETWLDAPPDLKKPDFNYCSRPCLQWGPPRCYPAYDCSSDGVPRTCPAGCTNGDCLEYGPETCRLQIGDTYRFEGCFMTRYGMSDSIANPTSPKYPGVLGRCPQTPILDLTKKADAGGTGLATVKSTISALVPVNDQMVANTYIAGGLEFGWHMLSSGKPFDRATSPADASMQGLTKAIVLMTDGANTQSPAPTAGTWNWSMPSARNEADAILKSLCTNVKNDGILIYTVAFSVDDEAARQMLKECASSPSYYYDARDSATLINAFRRIGDSLMRLRVAK